MAITKDLAIGFLIGAIVSYMLAMYYAYQAQNVSDPDDSHNSRKGFLTLAVICIILATMMGINIQKKSKKGFSVSEGINIAQVFSALILMYMARDLHWMSNILLGFIAIAGAWQLVNP